ncbi:flagellar basal body rod protein FlgB, partial [Mycobacterium tuberculosis]
MIDKLDAALRFNREALNLRAERQEVIAANIAHADTPNYKARDFDFSARLSDAVERGRTSSQSVSLATTSSRHLAGQA